MTSVSIISCGLYFPRYRLPAKEIARTWGSCSARLSEKAVPAFDEDPLTMGVAASRALFDGQSEPAEIGVLGLASTTLPYETKHVAGGLLEALSLGHECFVLECTQSGRSGTEALIATASYMMATGTPTGLVIAADAPTARPGDPLDHGLGAGACALLLSTKASGVRIDGWATFTSEHLGQRFRQAGSDNLQDLGVPGFAQHNYRLCAGGAISSLLRKKGLAPENFAGALVQDTDGRSGAQAARSAGFPSDRISTDWGDLYRAVGDLGAAASLAALGLVLSRTVGPAKWLICSYGAGSCCDALVLEMPETWNPSQVTGVSSLSDKVVIDYTQYLKLRRVI